MMNYTICQKLNLKNARDYIIDFVFNFNVDTIKVFF